MDDLRAENSNGLRAENSNGERLRAENSNGNDGKTVAVARIRFVNPAANAGNGIPLERTITDKILRWLRQQEHCWCFKVAGSGGQMRGVPDIVGCWCGWLFALEVKRPKLGRVSDIQQHVIDKITAAGGFVAVVRSLEEVQALFAMMGDRHE